MNRIRLPVFIALILSLLSACSQTDDIQDIGLEPQFGTYGYDYAESLAYTKTGILYVVGRLDAEGRLGGDPFLRRYNRQGTMLWEAYLNMDSAVAGSSVTHGVAADKTGNVYVAWSYDVHGYGRQSKLTKYSGAGTVLWTQALPGIIINIASDNAGNLYTTSGPNGPGLLIKYTSSGNRVWQRSIASSPWDLAVTATNQIYVIRKDRNLEKYTPDGRKLWTKSVALDGANPRMLIAGVNGDLFLAADYSPNGVYIDGCDYNSYYLWLFKLNGAGVRQWKKNMTENPTNRCLGITTDVYGNVYLTGSIVKQETQDVNAFYVKYNRAGTRLMFKGFATYKADFGRAIATYDGSEIYVAGWTYGSLAHSNIGGTDAVLRKMNKYGNRVWVR